MANKPRFDRIVWIVLDSVGIGELPDAADYGDVGRDTLGHIARSRPLHLPNLVRLGLANIKPLDHLAPSPAPSETSAKAQRFRRARIQRRATGKWPASGSTKPFPIYPHGFPKELIAEFEQKIGRRTLGNNRPPARRSSRSSERNMGARDGPSCTPRATAYFKSRRTRMLLPVAEIYRMCEIARVAAGRPQPRRPRDRSSVQRRGRELPAYRAPPRLRG